jgi:hypothetical protein
MGRCPGDDRWFCVGTEGGDGSVEDCADPDFGFTLDGGETGFTTLYVTASSTSSEDGTGTSSTDDVGTSDGGVVIVTETTFVPAATTFVTPQPVIVTVTAQPSSSTPEAGPGAETVTVDTTLTVWVPPSESTSSSSETASVWIETVPNPTDGETGTTTLVGWTKSENGVTIVSVTLTVVPVSEPSVTSDVGAPLSGSSSERR